MFCNLKVCTTYKEIIPVTIKKLYKIQGVLAAIMFVIVLVPVLTPFGYASELEHCPYYFAFKGGASSCCETKRDTASTAAVSINGANFNGGSVRFRLLDYNGSDLSYSSVPYSSLDTYTLYYYSNVNQSQLPMTVGLIGIPVGPVEYIYGNFKA